MTLLETMNEKFPIRKSGVQKEAFRKWVLGQMKELGYSPRVEENGSHSNIVAGNPETAQITFTAHYDTPVCIGLPNLMIPRNWPVYILYQGLIVVLLLALAFGGGLGLAALTKDPDMLRIGLLAVYMALILFMRCGPANRHNVNDNTSGVATVLEIMAKLPPEQREKAAFILFDDEEKGCAGSKAYAREHQQVRYTSLIVNLDCVGVGEHILLSVPKLARNMLQYQLLERVLAETEGRAVHFFSAATSAGSSDFRSFKCGVGVSAYRQTPGVGFCTGRIHTWRDTQADQGNIDFLSQALSACVEQLPDAEA